MTTIILALIYLVASSKKQLQENRDKLLEYKKTLHCKHCGIRDNRLIAFHHIGDKDHNVSSMVNHDYSWKRVEEEISKCVPLCCNCHRLEHWED